MTLIVDMATETSLVIAADRRLTDVRDKPDDAFQKLVLLGDDGIGTAYNFSRSLDPKSMEVQYSAYELLHAFFAGKKTTAQSVHEFDGFFRGEFQRFRDKHRPAIATTRGNSLISFLIYARVAGSFMRFERHYFPDGDGHSIRLRPFNHRFKDSAATGHAAKRLIDVIRDPSSHRFKELKADPRIRRHIINQPPPQLGEVKGDIPLEFCPWLITVCSKNYRQIDGKEPISPNCDVATVDESGARIVLNNYIAIG